MFFDLGFLLSRWNVQWLEDEPTWSSMNLPFWDAESLDAVATTAPLAKVPELPADIVMLPKDCHAMAGEIRVDGAVLLPICLLSLLTIAYHSETPRKEVVIYRCRPRHRDLLRTLFSAGALFQSDDWRFQDKGEHYEITRRKYIEPSNL